MADAPAPDDFPTLVSSLQASSVEWNALNGSFRLGGSGVFSSANLRNRYLRYMQVLEQIDALFASLRMAPGHLLMAWCASLQVSGVAPHFIASLMDHVAQGLLPHLALQRCLRLMDIFLGWTTRPNAGVGVAEASSSCPVLIPSQTVGRWVEQTWSLIVSLSKDTAGSTAPTTTAALGGALQVLPVLLRWCAGRSSLPAFRKGLFPHPVNMQSVEVRLLAYRALPVVLQHQSSAAVAQSCTNDVVEYVRRGCVKCTDISLRIAAACAMRGLLEGGLHVLTPAAAYAHMDMLLALCDDVSPYEIDNEVLHNVGIAMGYLFIFYQSDFRVSVLTDVLQAATEERADTHRRGVVAANGAGGGAVNSGGAAASGAAVRWQFFGGSDAVEGSRVVLRCFNERMTRTAQRALATAIATLCSLCATPQTTANAVQCCFVLLMPIEADARAYMPRLLADAILEWAERLPSNGYRVVLSDVLRGYVQKSSEDKTVVRTAMVALQGVVQTLSSSLAMGFNVAEDVVAAVTATPSLLHTGVDVLGAVARTNVLYARHLQHQCARVDSAAVANTLVFQLHIRALLDSVARLRASQSRSDYDCVPQRQRNSESLVVAGAAAGIADDALGEEDRVTLVHVCLRLLLRLSRGDPPRVVQDVHYRQAELIFRLTQLIHDLLHDSPPVVLQTVRDELQACTLGYMNLLVSSPAPSIAFYKAVTAACAMLLHAPLVSDTEKMLAVGFLESRLALDRGTARRDHDLINASSSAANAYFAVSKGALYHLIAAKSWATCRDDGSLRWLAAQALKDVARASAHGAPVWSFADVYGPVVAAAAHAMRWVRASLRRHAAADTAAAETPAHPMEECGGYAVRLLRWALRHFCLRKDIALCVALFTSLHGDLYRPYAAVPRDGSETVEAAVRREVALWNVLCAADAFLSEAALPDASELAQHPGWLAEVRRWQSATATLLSSMTGTALELRLLAARVHARCLLATGQVDAYTSQTVAVAAQAMSGSKAAPADSLPSLMVLCEAHSCAETGESHTLPLVTSLLAESWKQLANGNFSSSTAAAAGGGAAANVVGPVLTFLSLRLALVHPAEAEVALADSIVGLLLTPMTQANTQWWSDVTAPGMLTVMVQLWCAFPGAKTGVETVPHSAAASLVHEAVAVHSTPHSVAVAALDAVDAFTRTCSCCSNGTGDVRATRWRRLLLLSLDHATRPPLELEAVPSALLQCKGRHTGLRAVVQEDALSRQLARLWCDGLLSPSGEATCADLALIAAEGIAASAYSSSSSAPLLLTAVDVALQVDTATAANVRRAWVRVAAAVYQPLLPFASTSTSSSGSTGLAHAFTRLLATVHLVLQSHSPDVQVDLAKRDGDFFAAVTDGAAVAETAEVVRGGGGSDGDDAGDYADEFDEGAGGMLSEAANASAGKEANFITASGGAAGAAVTASGASAAAANGDLSSMTFDVAAKEAAMWILYGVLAELRCGGAEAEAVPGVVLPMVVAAAQLVEVHPEVELVTIAVLREVLRAWGDAVSASSTLGGAAANRPMPVLMPWKTQLVVSISTILQHGLLSLEGCTSLAVQFGECNLGDQASCRRVLRSLVLLLHACHRLQEQRRAFLLGGSGGAGLILVAMAKLAQAADARGGTAEAAQWALLRTFTSRPCQEALTRLCERFVSAVALVNGHAMASNMFGGTSAEATESAEWSRGVGCAFTSAGDVLQAVTFMTSPPLLAPLGAALRYATGCLAGLVLSCLSPLERGDGEADVDMVVLTAIGALSSQLTAQHQGLLAQLAQQQLSRLARCASGDDDRVHSQREEMALLLLLRIAAVAPIPKAQAMDTVLSCTPHLTAPSARGKDKEKEGEATVATADMAASLLCIALAASLPQHLLLPLLPSLSVAAMTRSLPVATTLRLRQLLGDDYDRRSPKERTALLQAVARASPGGLVWVWQSASAGALPHSRTPVLDQALWPAVKYLLLTAPDSLVLVAHLWDLSSHTTAAVREAVSQYRQEAQVLLALLGSFGSDTLPTATEMEAVAVRVLRVGPLLCALLLGLIDAPVTAAATVAQTLREVLDYVVTLLVSPLSVAYSVALMDVGKALVRTVAPEHGAALRDAIHHLGNTKAAQLRVFMEGSCN